MTRACNRSETRLLTASPQLRRYVPSPTEVRYEVQHFTGLRMSAFIPQTLVLWQRTCGLAATLDSRWHRNDGRDRLPGSDDTEHEAHAVAPRENSQAGEGLGFEVRDGLVLTIGLSLQWDYGARPVLGYRQHLCRKPQESQDTAATLPRRLERGRG